jgi:2-polyprenyl-3-methyl-5-hydroxy-6-metoxy-1,4-benzoquinol methylase
MNHLLPLAEVLTSCIGCGSFSLRQNFYPNNVCKCASCGLLFRNPRPTQTAILQSYNQGSTFDQWRAEGKQRAAMWTIRANIVRHFSKGNNLLDIGTGDGMFLKFANRVGFSVEGTDASENGAERALETGFKVYTGDLETLDIKGPYDVITIWHVLEHVPFPRETLLLVHKLLKPEGILVIAVPNELKSILQCLLRFKRAKTFHALQSGTEIHLTHFTPRTLKNLVNASGFEIVDFGVDYASPFAWKARDFRTMLYRVISRIFGTHPANCMQIVARKI